MIWWAHLCILAAVLVAVAPWRGVQWILITFALALTAFWLFVISAVVGLL